MRPSQSQSVKWTDPKCICCSQLLRVPNFLPHIHMAVAGTCETYCTNLKDPETTPMVEEHTIDQLEYAHKSPRGGRPAFSKLLACGSVFGERSQD